MDFFSPEGIAAWQSRLNHSPEFADAAAHWAGRLVLVERGGDRQTWLVVSAGRCTEARPALAADHGTADFILAADASTWADLVGGQSTPMQAAMAGRLSLLKGSAFALLPHARAAAALLAAAANPSD